MAITDDLLGVFKTSVSSIFARDTHTVPVESPTYDQGLENRYEQLRSSAGDLLSEYSAHPTNMALVSKCDRLVAELDVLAKERVGELGLSGPTDQRLKTNIVTISATAKRTHYAAYMAGCWGNDATIESPYRAWLHNGAAHGAISLYENLHTASKHIADVGMKELLAVHADGAFFDAARFLAISDTIDPSCVITAYNRAKLEVLEGDRIGSSEGDALIRLGITRLKGIKPPTNRSHVAELGWHGNLLKSYGDDGQMVSVIGRISGMDVEIIRETLERNATDAGALIRSAVENQTSPERVTAVSLEPPSDRTRAVVVATATGVLLVACAVASQLPWKDITHAVLTHMHFVNAQIAMATGGLASTGGLELHQDHLFAVRTVLGSATGGL